MILLDGEVRKKEAEQQRKVQDETLRAAIKSVDEEYTATASGINNQYKLREITAEKQSALLLAANEKRFASEQELQAKLLALWNSDPVQFQKVLNEMAAAWQKYQKTAQTTNQTVTLEIKKQNEDIAKEIGGPFKSAFEGAFDAMIKGGQTAQQTMLKFVEMVAEGFEKLIAKIILAIAEQLILNAITGGTAAAPGLAGAIGKGLGLFSAAGGYDVPSNINPVTQLHQEEMVLPADLANNVRGMAGGSRGQGGGQGGGHTFNIYALLPKDAASAVKQALRMGHR